MRKIVNEFKTRLIRCDGVDGSSIFPPLEDKDFTIDFWIKFPRPFDGNQFMQNRFLRRN